MSAVPREQTWTGNAGREYRRIPISFSRGTPLSSGREMAPRNLAKPKACDIDLSKKLLTGTWPAREPCALLLGMKVRRA
jgi:hypothetical protein